MTAGTYEFAALGNHWRSHRWPAFLAALTRRIAQGEADFATLRLADPEEEAREHAKGYLMRFRDERFLDALSERGYDISPDVGEMATQADVYPSVAAMLDAGPADVLFSAVPASDKLDVARAALLAGRHVQSAKPTAPTPDEAEEMIAIARECRRSLEIGYHLGDMMRPASAWLRGLSEAGEFGPISGVLLEWTRWDGIPQAPRSYDDRRYGGVMRSQGSHLLRALIRLTGSRPVACRDGVLSNRAGVARREEIFVCEDTISGIAELENGVPARIHATWWGVPPGEQARAVVFGKPGEWAEIPIIVQKHEEYMPDPDAFRAVLRREHGNPPKQDGPTPLDYQECMTTAAFRALRMPQLPAPTVDDEAVDIERGVAWMLESAWNGGARIGA